MLISLLILHSKEKNIKNKIKHWINVAEKEKFCLRDLGQKFRIIKNQSIYVLQEKEKRRKLWILNSNENSKIVIPVTGVVL